MISEGDAIWRLPFAVNVIAHDRYIKILTWLRVFRDKLANFHNSIVSQFPEETWAQRKSNQI